MDGAIQIGAKAVWRDGPPLVMAEIGVNHDGDVEKGLRLVTEAAAATCEAVKFQLFRAELLLAKEADSAGELLKGLEMSVENMGKLVRRAKELGMAAVVTPFSVELVGVCVEM